MRRTVKRTFGIKKGLKGMITGGIGKSGPYAYAGIRHRTSGLSGGASIGTKGRQLHASLKRKQGSIKVRHNLETKRTSVTAKVSKRSLKRLFR